MKKGKIIAILSLILFFILIFLSANNVSDGYAFFDSKNVSDTSASIGISGKFHQSSVFFNSNGGTSVDTLKGYTYDFISEPETPTKQNYDFIGWYSDASFNNEYTFNEYGFNDITLYAKWELASFTISFDSRGGDDINPINQVYGTNVYAPIAPSRSGYDFVGWYSDIEITSYYQFTTMPGENITLFAEWGSADLSYTSITGGYSVNGGTNASLNIVIPNRYFGSLILEIEAQGFKNNKNMVGISIPSTVTIIGNQAFMSTTNLASINIPTSIITLGNGVFRGCSSLTTIFLPINVENIGQNTFKDCSSLTIYTQTISKPAGWDNAWNVDNRPVVWGSYIYMIIFETNGGSVVNSLMEKVGTPVSEPQEPTKTGYEFDGWYSDFELTQIYIFTTMPAYSSIIYAKWNLSDYTISFESNGGSLVSPITQEYTTEVASPTSPNKYGYSFNGWYSDIELTQVYTITTMPYTDITLYAKWVIAEFTISFESNGGNSISSITQNYQTTITKPTDPIKTGYSFGGWYSDEQLTTRFAFVTMPGEDIKLYARWGTNFYVITFQSNGGSVVPTIIEEYGNSITAPEIPTKLGHTFDSWYTNTGLTNKYTFNTMPSSNFTLYAKWNVVQYTITFNSSGGSNVGSITRNYGSSVSSPSNPNKSGYVFAGWYSDLNITQYFTFTTMPAENITLYAEWGTQGLVYTSISGGYKVKSGTATAVNIIIPNRYLGESILEIENNAFDGYANLNSIILPDTITKIGARAFRDCRNLTSINIPTTVINIGANAFKACSSLTQIYISINVVSMGNIAFGGCSALTIYVEASSKPSGWSSTWNKNNCPVFWGYI